HELGANALGLILNGQKEPFLSICGVERYHSKPRRKKQADSSKETLCIIASSFFRQTGHN
ncbi:MAG: hypothetical protein ACI4OM_03910, partial [Evtepia sp.]